MKPCDQQNTIITWRKNNIQTTMLLPICYHFLAQKYRPDRTITFVTCVVALNTIRIRSPSFYEELNDSYEVLKYYYFRLDMIFAYQYGCRPPTCAPWIDWTEERVCEMKNNNRCDATLPNVQRSCSFLFRFARCFNSRWTVFGNLFLWNIEFPTLPKLTDTTWENISWSIANYSKSIGKRTAGSWLRTPDTTLPRSKEIITMAHHGHMLYKK